MRVTAAGFVFVLGFSWRHHSCTKKGHICKARGTASFYSPRVRAGPSSSTTRGADGTALYLSWLTALGETTVKSPAPFACVWSGSVSCQIDRRKPCFWHRMSSLVPNQQIVTNSLLCNCWMREGSQRGIWANNMIWFQLFLQQACFLCSQQYETRPATA